MENEKELRVLEAAKVVFLRYGFRRATMQDLAEEAGISRPALYLVFPNKEEVFKAAARQLATENMAAIRAGLGQLPNLEAQLKFTFDLWSVRPFEMMLSSPDAKDLVQCAQGFARETIQQVSVEFEALLVEILRPLTANRAAVLPAPQIAHLLAASTHGYKESAASAEELRQLISGLIVITLAALRA